MLTIQIGSAHIKAKGNRVSVFVYGVGLHHFAATVTDRTTLGTWLAMGSTDLSVLGAAAENQLATWNESSGALFELGA